MECGDAPGLSFHYTYRSDKVHNNYEAPTAGVSVLCALLIDKPDIDLSKSEGKIQGCTLTIEYGLHIQDVWDMGSRYADTPRTVWLYFYRELGARKHQKRVLK